jgi:hypothetical protein
LIGDRKWSGLSVNELTSLDYYGIEELLTDEERAAIGRGGLFRTK